MNRKPSKEKNIKCPIHEKSENFSVVSDSLRLLGLQSMEFSRPEYWSGQPFPSSEDLPNPGIEPRSLTLQADSLPAEPQGSPYLTLNHNKCERWKRAKSCKKEKNTRSEGTDDSLSLHGQMEMMRKRENVETVQGQNIKKYNWPELPQERRAASQSGVPPLLTLSCKRWLLNQGCRVSSASGHS